MALLLLLRRASSSSQSSWLSLNSSLRVKTIHRHPISSFLLARGTALSDNGGNNNITRSSVHPMFLSTDNSGGSKDKSPREKLHDIIETYRQLNYGQETFTRFIKDVVKAADENKDGIICVKEVEHLLTNIGAHDALTPEEIKHIMEDLGCADHLKQSDDTGIPATRVVDFFHLEATPASPPPSALSSSSSSNNSKKA